MKRYLLVLCLVSFYSFSIKADESNAGANLQKVKGWVVSIGATDNRMFQASIKDSITGRVIKVQCPNEQIVDNKIEVLKAAFNKDAAVDLEIYSASGWVYSVSTVRSLN